MHILYESRAGMRMSMKRHDTPFFLIEFITRNQDFVSGWVLFPVLKMEWGRVYR